MPGVSQNQVVAMRIAKAHPEKLYKRNQVLAKMSGNQLEDFIHTPTKGLPKKVGYKMGANKK